MAAEEKKQVPSVFVQNITALTSPEGIQKYLLGTKKNGYPRAVYDVVKDCMGTTKKKKGKKKKHKKDKSPSTYSFYINSKDKKKKKKKNHWHI